MSHVVRRLPVGAEVQPDGSTHFRVWAPRPKEARLVLECGAGAPRDVPLTSEGNGYYSTSAADVGAGCRYRYRLDGTLLADPASRFQPDGPAGPSQVVNPAAHRWTDAAWPGLTLRGQVLYEMHIGTFTHEGTWNAARERLPDLRATGVTAIEVMPVAEFPGRFGWGYDGVLPFAPTRLYGTPDDFRAFVDTAHALGLGVVLDVVYNHFGPSCCVHRDFADTYFSSRYANEWGEPLNFDGPGSAPVREYFVANAGYWVDEFHVDGLRLDAVQSMHDASPDHVVAAIARGARAAGAPREVLVIAEHEAQRAEWVRLSREQGGLDALWNDDFHHTAVVALTGRREAYYSDHGGTPQEFISAAKRGYLFQGQRYRWQSKDRGTRTDQVPPAAFVTYTENHDQVANSGDGSRLHQRSAPGRYRAVTALLLLLPNTPMLFQGQEFASTSPFLFFADHAGDLAESVRRGRAAFVSQFPSLATPEAQDRLPAPHEEATFERCKLRWEERRSHAAHRRLHEDLLALRREEAAFARQEPGGIDGAVLGPEAFVLRYAAATGLDERLLVVNLGIDLVAESFAEPLVAPPDGCRWQTRWSSEHPAYGGTGASDIVTADGWRVPGHSATVLSPAANRS